MPRKTVDEKERLYQEVLQECGVTIAHLCRAFYPLDDDLRDDLYSAVVQRLWDKLHLYRPTGSLAAWAYRVALNTARNHHRHTAFRRRLFIPIDTVPEQHLPYVDPDGDDDEENYRRLYRLVALLDSGDREMLTLYFDGKTTGEMAEILAITPSNVTTRLNRIKNQLIEMHRHGKDEPPSELYGQA